MGRHVNRCPIKLAFHDADTDTDILADILARIVARISACRSAYRRNNFRKSRVSDESARILVRMFVSVSVSASWNSSLTGDANDWRLFRCCRLLAVLHQQHRQPCLLRSVQRQLSSHVLAHSAVPLGHQAPKHLVMTSSRTCRTNGPHRSTAWLDARGLSMSVCLGDTLVNPAKIN